MKSKAAGFGSISTVISSIVLILSIIIITIIIIMMIVTLISQGLGNTVLMSRRG